MRYLALFLLLLSLGTFALAEENQAYWGVFAETKLMKMAGMPAIELPAGMDPAMLGGMALPGMPERLLSVRLWSPNIAPKDASAYITPPPGLKLGNKLDLELYRPKPGQVGPEKSEFNPDTIKDFTIFIYWGSSETVKEGQPKVIKWTGLTDEQKAAMREQANTAQKAQSYFYKPNWTTGYWPTKKQPGKIAKDASLVGTYALKTNYTGSIKIDAPNNVEFLAPIDLVSPKMENAVPMEPAIKLQWQPVPNALGIAGVAIGMQGKNTMIIWSASEVYSEAMMSADWGYMQMAMVREMVEKTVMMKGDATAATIPAGIFKQADMVMLQMNGYGPGSALGEGQPLPRIQTKTSLMAMLGGKHMAEMGGMGE
jgi:hypothetical protein